MIRAVIFDLDNTVYNYDECHEEAMKNLQEYACEKYALDTKTFNSKFDDAKKIVKNQLGNTGASHNRLLYMQTFLESIGRKPVDGAIELYNVYWDTMLENMHLFPYVLPLMIKLKENKICIGVLTDLTAHIQHRKIQKMGLTDYVEVLVTSEEAGKEKPSEIAFDKLKAKIKFAPEEILMIGDSQEKDIDGALQAGMHGILFSIDKASNMDQLVMEYINDRVDKA